jgi:iron complex transport system substrate-binding protein
MRILSLLAGATEMVAELGCLDQMVGRSHECDYPPEVLRLPLVSTVQIDTTASSAQIDAQIQQRSRQQQSRQENALQALSIYSINVSLLQQLRPDIIFTQMQCEVCAVSERDVLAALQQTTGLQPRIIALTPYRLSDVWEDMYHVGCALGRQEQAKARINDYKKSIQDLQTSAEALNKHGSKPRVAILEWLDPLMGAGNWIPELITYAGAEPVCGESGMHSPWLNWEELLQADPDVLILAPCGFSLERIMLDLPLLQQQPAWRSLSAVRKGRVYAVDGNHYLNRSGPRLVASAEILAHIIWGKSLERAAHHQGWMHIHPET